MSEATKKMEKIIIEQNIRYPDYKVISNVTAKEYQNNDEIKKLLMPMPLTAAKLFARFFELTMKNPLLTRDQLRLLKYDNISTGKYRTNSEIGIPSLRYFNEEVKKHCYMWRDGGQFSTEKYMSNKDLENKAN